ncbi:hypothetical protein V6Z92_001966 [Aspergillus fumigatus]
MGAPATNSETIHVVNKADNRQHAVVNLDSSLDEELPVSALRARPILLGLTSNNLSYARGGDLLHWWETYPVPHTAPPPYNDQASWGIVPAWGYATVTESMYFLLTHEHEYQSTHSALLVSFPGLREMRISRLLL